MDVDLDRVRERIEALQGMPNYFANREFDRGYQYALDDVLVELERMERYDLLRVKR